jgi:MFS family permease
VIIAAAAVAFFVSAFGRNYQVTMAAMAKSTYNAGAGGYGMLSVVFAAGALVGGVVAARVRNHRLQLVVGAAVVGSVLQLAGALMPTFASFAVAIFQIAVVAVVFDTVTSCVVQRAAGDAFRGRAIAVLGTVSMLGVTVGGPTLGWLADHFGPRSSLEYGAALVLVGTAVVATVHLARSGAARARVVELWSARADRATAVIDAAA